MREEFPIFKKHPDLIYFDSAATAQKPYSVINALSRFYSEEYATIHRSVYHHAIKAAESYNETREVAAKFLGASFAEEIIFTRGTTAALNLVAMSYGKTFLKEGDEILITEMEHHSNLVPWQMLAKEKRAILRYIPMNQEGILEWEETIREKTKIVALAHVSNVTGTINPIRKIARAAHEKGAVIVVDGAQAAPHLSIDVKSLDVDFYAFSGHKCYGPTGVGVLYGKKDLLEKMPPVEGGGDMIEQVTFDRTTYQKPPLRFEAGTPIIGSVIALKEALKFVRAHQSPDHLLSYATEKLNQIESVQIIGRAPEKCPLITFHIEGIHSLDLATFLSLKKIAIRSGHLCASPVLSKFNLKTAARISFGVYNTTREVDLFIEELHEILKRWVVQSR